MLAENLVRLGFLQSVSCIKPILTHEKLFAVGKSGPNATFNLIFLGLGWPWVGEFVGFIIVFTCVPTQHSLVNRKHRNVSQRRFSLLLLLLLFGRGRGFGDQRVSSLDYL